MDHKSTNLSTLASNIKLGIEARIKDLHTSCPGIIVSFDAATQLASVQPAVKRMFKTDDGDKEILIPQALPVLINVLVQFPRGGGFSLTFPVKKDDECLLVFCERSIDSWHNNGGVQSPTNKRFHHLSDATAFVGLSSLVNKVPNYDAVNTQIKKDDGTVFITLRDNEQMDIHADGAINMDSLAAINITAPLTTITGNVDIVGAFVRHNGTAIDDTHIHSQGPDSNGDSEVNTDPPI